MAKRTENRESNICRRHVRNAAAWILLLCSVCFAVADANLVAHWTMDDNTDSNIVVDSTGDFNGLFADVNTAAHSVKGKIGSALSFDGTSDYIDANGSLAEIFDDSFTINVWVKIESYAGEAAMLCGVVDTTGPNWYYVEFYFNRTSILTNYNTTGAGLLGQISEVNLPLSDWQMLTLVVENLSGTAISIKHYVNGFFLEESGSVGCSMAAYASTEHFYLAASNVNGQAGELFDGALDDVRVFNKALDANEVWQLYYDVEGANGQYFLAGN
jgi:hypothetical protein